MDAWKFKLWLIISSVITLYALFLNGRLQKDKRSSVKTETLSMTDIIYFLKDTITTQMKACVIQTFHMSQHCIISLLHLSFLLYSQLYYVCFWFLFTYLYLFTCQHHVISDRLSASCACRSLLGREMCADYDKWYSSIHNCLDCCHQESSPYAGIQHLCTNAHQLWDFVLFCFSGGTLHHHFECHLVCDIKYVFCDHNVLCLMDLVLSCIELGVFCS